MDHRCLVREKFDLLKSPLGQAAYLYYSEWMRLQKRSVPPQETFLHSRQFRYMMNFAEWVEKLGIPNPTQFIKLMIESGTQPLLWCRDNTYSMYLEWYDGVYPPENQFISSLDFIKQEWPAGAENPFDQFTPSEIASLIRKKRLSPWFLLSSQKFIKYLMRQQPHDSQVINDALNFNAFVDKIKSNPELMREFKAACAQEGLS